MPSDPRILAGKPLNFFLRQTSAQPYIQLSREVVVELRKKFDVEKKDGGLSEFRRDDIQENFWAEILGVRGVGGRLGALLGF